MAVDPAFDFGSHESQALGTLDEHEIHDGRSGYASEDTCLPLHLGLKVETEEHTAQELHYDTEYESYGHGEEYAEDYLQRFLRIYHVYQIQPRLAAVNLEKRCRKRRSEQPEYKRHGGRRWHTEVVENVKQHNVRDHHSHADTQDVEKREILRPEYAVAGYIHHAVTHHGPDEHTETCHQDYALVRGHLGPYSRIKEVDGIIADTH